MKLPRFLRSIPRQELLFISLILLLALGLRLYRIDGYLTFLGDEGRDVRVVRNILQGDPAFIGPQTSIGNMYLGPLYYYMMAPFLLLWNFNPVGPAIMVALLGTLTIAFTWWVGRTWFSPLAGLIAAFFFSISPVAIIYSKSSWNPNPMPFFALLAFWSLYQVWQNRRFIYLLVLGVSIAFALQMHYLGLLLFPSLGLLWLVALKRYWNTKDRHSFVKFSLLGFLSFLLLMSPLLLFDIKHGFPNYQAFTTFFTNRQTTINLNPLNSDRFLLVLNKLTDDLVMATSHSYLTLASVTLIVLSLFYLIRTSKDKKNYLTLLLWVVTGYLGLVVYKQHVYAHYFGFLFPAYYLLLGVLLSKLVSSSLPARFLAITLLLSLSYLYLQHSPLRTPPNNQLSRTQEAVDQIISASGGKEFNFALIAKRNYDESYRYFFELKQAPLVRGEDRLTDQLFVICEDGDACQPEGNPQYQVAIFGPAHVVESWQLDHLKLYKLVPSQ